MIGTRTPPASTLTECLIFTIRYLGLRGVGEVGIDERIAMHDDAVIDGTNPRPVRGFGPEHLHPTPHEPDSCASQASPPTTNSSRERIGHGTSLRDKSATPEHQSNRYSEAAAGNNRRTTLGH
jgi:hypothetical protein